MVRLISFIVFAAMAFASCAIDQQPADPVAGDPSPQKTVEELRRESFDDIDVEACVAGGGSVSQAGLLGMYSCITPFSDAGASCADASDCEGRCMGKDGVTDYDAAPGEAVGVCEANDSPFGCYATIENGTTSPFICVD